MKTTPPAGRLMEINWLNFLNYMAAAWSPVKLAQQV